MKSAHILIILSAAFVAWLAWPALALAQEPICDSATLTFNFSQQSQLDNFTGHTCWDTYGPTNPGGVRFGANAGPSCYEAQDPPYLSLSQLQITKAAILSSLELHPLTTINSVNAFGYFETYNNAYRESRIRIFDGESLLTELLHGSESNYSQQFGTSTINSEFTHIEWYQFHNNYTNYPNDISILDYVTININYCEPPPPPVCPTVTDAQFENEPSAWTIYPAGPSAANISDGEAHLFLAGDKVAKNEFVNRNFEYIVNIEVTDVSTPTDILVHLGPAYDTITVNGSGLFTTTLTTPNFSPVEISVELRAANSVDIDYICLGWPFAGPPGSECIAPTNGTFEAGSIGWDTQRGAAWSASNRAMVLPYEAPGILQSGAMWTSQFYDMPTVEAGQYLIYEYNARASGESGITLAGVWTAGRIDEFASYVEVFPQFYRYQFDISAMAEKSVEIGVANPGFDPLTGTSMPGEVVVDDICIFLSDDPPALPAPSGDMMYPNIDLGQFYSCGDVDMIFFTLAGIDLRYHRANYAATPGAWDFSDWVPWLISAVWVMVQVFFCAYLVLWQTLVNLIEYGLNNAINIFNWSRLSLVNFSAWFVPSFWGIIDTWASALDAILETAGDWLPWLANVYTVLSGLPSSLLTNWILTSLLYGTSGLLWLVAVLNLLSQVVGSDIANELVYLANILINDGLNPFIDALGPALSAIANSFIGIWNDSLHPFLQFILPFLAGGALAYFFPFFGLFWNFLWATIQYFWVNVFDGLYIPLAFYTGLSEGVQSTAFSDLLSCDGSTTNFWCNMFAALDLVNGVAGHSIFYPIIIVGIIIATIAILYRNFIGLWDFYTEWLTKI